MTRAGLACVVALAAAPMALLAPRPAGACGAFYGDEVEVEPDQEIVVVHRGGVETYVFSPRFCGVATEFGVILPIPSTLSAAPSLDDAALFEQLDRYTEPAQEVACKPSGISCAGAAGDDPGTPPPFGEGVDVVDKGTVGIFEWSLLQATSVEAFTDWLTANGFPYDPSQAPAYLHYVNAGWYFVAFKVSADVTAPPEGMRLCGDLGPIRLSFPAAAPVVPARIAGVNVEGYAQPTWRLYVVASTQQRLEGSSDFYPTLYFAGPLADAELADYGEIAALAQDGEWLTAIDVPFPWDGVGTDILLEADPAPAAFRSTVTRYEDCEGCGTGGTPAGLAAAAAFLGLLRALRRSREAPR